MKLLNHNPKPYHGLDEKTAYELGVLNYNKDIKQMLEDMKYVDNSFLEDMRKLDSWTWKQYQAIINGHNKWVTRSCRPSFDCYDDSDGGCPEDHF